jgi:nicotinic acid phosphoribosyltransferase
MKALLGYLTEENLSLSTDYYELTMCAAYFDNKNFENATSVSSRLVSK